MIKVRTQIGEINLSGHNLDNSDKNISEEIELATALANEDYESAAEIRDRLDK